MSVISVILLAIGYLFTFFIPGFLLIELLFKKLKQIYKLPLYLLLSVLLSTYTVYFLSLIIGFSRQTILLSFVFYLPLAILLFKKKGFKFSTLLPKRKHTPGILLAGLVFIVFLISLYPAIFFKKGNGYVMSAVNWQDTAMHLGIIETISQGNFPPQAPYFAGRPLNYYYFTDFHSAILNTLYGKFFPRILVYTNPMFVLMFALSIYSLSYFVIKSKTAAIISSLLGVFTSNMMFFYFFSDLDRLLKQGNPLLNSVFNLLEKGGYTMKYGEIVQMVPIADYFLQNRPMMVGLPAVATIILLVFIGYREKRNHLIVLAGLITGIMVKFQLFAMFVGLIVFGYGVLFNINRYNFKYHFRKIIGFTFPVILFISLIIFQPLGSPSIIRMLKTSLNFGPWIEGKTISWFIKFYILNLNLPFIIALVLTPIFISKLKKKRKNLIIMYSIFLSLGLIPLLLRITAFGYDMLKIFYFMIIAQSILASYLLAKVWKKKYIGKFIVTLVVFISSLTAILTIFWSFLDKKVTYPQEVYQAGMWIRENTGKRAVFAGIPTVHSPITQIGGRLRVLSYINWPYSHGYDIGEDNVFSRLEDMKMVYNSDISQEVTNNVLNKYKINYIYLGSEETREYPLSEKKLESMNGVNLVYNSGGIKIYEVD